MGRGAGAESETGYARGDAYPALPVDHPLRPLLARFDQVAESHGTWTCDGGAAALSHLLARHGIAHTPIVGLYHWPQERLADKWRLLEGGDPDPEDLEGYWDDEHHHWIEVDGWLIDPNGEIRGEPRLQRSMDAPQYEAREDYEQLSWSPWFQRAEANDPDGEWGVTPYSEAMYTAERPAWAALLG